MIPIDPTKPVRRLDEKSGVTYLFRVLTDEMQDAYAAACALADRGKAAETEQEKERFYKEHHRALVNLFLAGWESNSNNLPEFPSDGNPARLLPGLRLSKMLEILNSAIRDLIGIDEEDVKN